MMGTLKHIVILIALGAIESLELIAQDTLYFPPQLQPDSTTGIHVITKYAGDSVIVRWAPAQASEWITLNKQGYRIERIQLDKQGLPIAGTKTVFHVSAWPLDRFQHYTETGSDYLIAAAQCLYGEWESAETEGLNLHGRFQELQNRFGISLLAADLDPLAASALGLRMSDGNIRRDYLYLYQVFPADTALHIHPGFSSVLTVPVSVATPEIDHIAEDEGYVNIKWRREDHEADFSAYWIEYSNDNRQFSKLNTVPFVGGESEEYPSPYFSFRHNVENYHPHYYRIIGLNAFGESSSPSIAKYGQARDRTPPAKPGQPEVICDDASGTVRLKWQTTSAPDHAGYHVYRAPRFEGEYIPVTSAPLSPGTATWQESIDNTRMIWYYKIAAIDTAGNMNSSRIVQAAFRDTVPPATPVGLTGKIDSAGVVTLVWNKGVEPDLRGYYVYMANQADHYFTNMTAKPLYDTVWTDTITLKTFTENIYYRVAAVDFHAQFSEWTAPLELSKPDTIRPFPPAFAGYRVEKDHVVLQYTPSRSKDITRHTLERRVLSRQEWTPLTEFNIIKETYSDYGVEAGSHYEYRLTAFDDAGLTHAAPVLLRVKYFDRSRPEAPVISLTSQNENELVLNIAFDDPRVTDLIIYRSVNDAPPTTIDRIQASHTYQTRIPASEANYAYRVKAVRDDEQKSDFSNTIIIDHTQ